MKVLNQILALVGVTVVMSLVSCNFMEPTNPTFQNILWEEELGLEESDEDILVDEMDAEYYEGEDGLRSPKCLSLVFPVTVVFPDGSTESFDSGEAIKEAIRAYYEENGKGGGRPHLQLPFDVELGNGDIITVESRAELKNLAKDCARKRKHIAVRKCLDLLFPVTINFPDGEQLEVASKEELRDALEAWRMDNPGAGERPKLDLPFDVQTVNGNIFTITSKEDIKAALEDCKG